MQACADKLEREIQLYCDPDKPDSLPVFPDEEPDAAVSLGLFSHKSVCSYVAAA